ncbi:MAG: 2'-5' RNA ligase family protein [Propionibacteriaceae bacterium]|jgi:hypothetical protein|nr:2'-5' RNA ligase family protein [Propionibacteriaceae bacterium]
MSTFPVGVTGLVVAVPEADQLIGDLRVRYVREVEGLPAHVTVLYPWLPQELIDAHQLSRLRAVAATLEPFDAQLCGVGRFPGTLWLKPTPTEAFVALTNAVWRQWPDYPPFEGQYDEVIPHLTVAESQTEDLLDHLRQSLPPFAPFSFRVTELTLLAFNGQAWRPLGLIPLGARPY